MFAGRLVRKHGVGRKGWRRVRGWMVGGGGKGEGGRIEGGVSG
jgi:hypothetical protein